MIRKKTAAVDALDVADASMFKGRALRQAARKATGADITVHTRYSKRILTICQSFETWPKLRVAETLRKSGWKCTMTRRERTLGINKNI